MDVFEGFSNEKISKHMLYTAFFVIPTLPMFIIFPLLIGKFDSIGAVVIGMVLTIVLLALTDKIVRYFGGACCSHNFHTVLNPCQISLTYNKKFY